MFKAEYIVYLHTHQLYLLEPHILFVAWSSNCKILKYCYQITPWSNFRIFSDGRLLLFISWLRSSLGLLRKTGVLGTLASISSWLDDRELDPDLRLAISLSINGSNSFNFQSLLPFPWTKRVLLLYIVITVFWFCSRINVSSSFSFLFN